MPVGGRARREEHPEQPVQLVDGLRERLFRLGRVEPVLDEVGVLWRRAVGAEEQPGGGPVLVVGEQVDELAERGHLVLEHGGQLAVLLAQLVDELTDLDLLRLPDLLLLLALARVALLVLLGALLDRRADGVDPDALLARRLALQLVHLRLVGVRADEVDAARVLAAGLLAHEQLLQRDHAGLVVLRHEVELLVRLLQEEHHVRQHDHRHQLHLAPGVVQVRHPLEPAIDR